jgi:hypothetical protein
MAQSAECSLSDQWVVEEQQTRSSESNMQTTSCWERDTYENLRNLSITNIIYFVITWEFNTSFVVFSIEENVTERTFIKKNSMRNVTWQITPTKCDLSARTLQGLISGLNSGQGKAILCSVVLCQHMGRSPPRSLQDSLLHNLRTRRCQWT